VVSPPPRTFEELMMLPARELRALLTSCGVSAAGLVEKADLAREVLDALQRSSGGGGGGGASSVPGSR
jgi:hypothetical protein